MIKSILLTVQTQLTAIAELKYISEDWGQLDYYEQPPVLFPCALIDTDTVEYSDNTRRSQQAILSFSIRVADLRLFNTSTDAPRADEAYDIFELLQKIHIALHGLSSDLFSPISRVRTVRVQRDDSVREFRITFKCGYTDSNAKITEIKNPVPPNIGFRR